MGACEGCFGGGVGGGYFNEPDLEAQVCLPLSKLCGVGGEEVNM